MTPTLLGLGVILMVVGAAAVFISQNWTFLVIVGVGVVAAMFGVLRGFVMVNLFNSVIQAIALAMTFIGVVLAVLFNAWYWTFIAILVAIVLLLIAFFCNR